MGTVYADRYVAWQPDIDALDPLLCEICDVPSTAVNYRRVKYIGKRGSLHVTIVSPPEITLLSTRMGWQYDTREDAERQKEMFDTWHDGSASTILIDLAEPHLRLQRTEYLDERKQKKMRSYTLPVAWTTVQLFRKALNLPPAELHFTLGLEEIST
jgi:hypothetical protein